MTPPIGIACPKSTNTSFPHRIPPRPLFPSPFDEKINLSKDSIWTENITTNLHKNKFQLISTNIRSLSKNFIEFKNIIKVYQPDFIALCEVWKPHTPFVSLEGYQIVLKLRPPNKKGGGVAMYISNKYDFKMNEKIDNLKLTTIEAIAVNITIQNNILTLISIYRPPDTKQTDTLDDFEKILSTIENKCIITGDVNIDYSNNNCLKTAYDTKLTDWNMFQFVKAYTRLTSQTNTIIDHVISNMTNLETMVTHHEVADHQMIITQWGEKNKVKTDILDKQHTSKKLHYKDTITNLKKFNWKSWITETKCWDIDKTYDSFHNIIQSALKYENKKNPKRYVPIQSWMTPEVLYLKRDVENARKKFLKNSNTTNETNYKTLKSTYKNAIKNAYNHHYINKLQKAGKDSKKTWQIIGEVLNRKPKSEKNTKIIHENKTLVNDLEIASTLSDYYKHAATNKIKELKSDMNFQKFLNPLEKKIDKFKLKNISKEDTWFYIKSITPKPSYGFDGVPSKLLNLAAPVLVSPLTTIINKCFSSGKFPEKLKLSKITPVLKKEPPEPGNFRPISQLSCFSKVIEKASLDQFEKYLKQNFNDERQFAYKTNHSTVHPILLTRNLIEKELQKGNYVCLALIDLSLAFDTVECQTILPAKLKHYGADDVTTRFFTSFFNNRRQYTEWNGAKSSPIDLFNHSCVQGSCLGPTVYNHYTQELNQVTICEAIMFADDTNYILSDKDPNTLIKRMNTELMKTHQYMTENTLIVNKLKSNYLIFKPPKKKAVKISEKMYINNTEITRLKHARFLGVWFDDKLKFDKQFEMVTKKLENTIKALICTRNIFNYKTKLLIYNSLFKSHIDYCTITYMDKLNNTQMDKLIKLQKKAVRLIFSARGNVHTSKLFALSKIIPINKLYETEAIKFMLKYKNEIYTDLQPLAIKKIILKTDTSRNTRSKNDKDLKIHIKNVHKTGQCIFNLFSTWNNTKSDLRMAGNLFSLKKMIKEKFTDTKTQCEVNNCYICNIDKNRNYEKYMQQ